MTSLKMERAFDRLQNLGLADLQVGPLSFATFLLLADEKLVVHT